MKITKLQRNATMHQINQTSLRKNKNKPRRQCAEEKNDTVHSIKINLRVSTCDLDENQHSVLMSEGR